MCVCVCVCVWCMWVCVVMCGCVVCVYGVGGVCVGGWCVCVCVCVCVCMCVGGVCARDIKYGVDNHCKFLLKSKCALC